MITIRDQILVKDVLKQLVTLVNEDLASVSNQRKEYMATSNQELAEVNGRLERLYDALETGKLSLDDLHPRIQQLRQRLHDARHTHASLMLAQNVHPKVVQERQSLHQPRPT